MAQNGVVLDGFPSFEEIGARTGWPTAERFQKGPVAVVECVQPIPCNPCESACPYGAILVGDPITQTPRLNTEKCVGCGVCVTACSGLAIFIVDKSLKNGKASVSFPYEYLPLPKKGDAVKAVGRDGAYVCAAAVLRVLETAKSDHTPVVTLELPAEHADAVRGMQRLGRAAAAGFKDAAPNEDIPDELLVCRCEEVTAGEIRRAVRQYKGTSVTEVKRRARCGMGLCQGKSCGRLVTRIIAEETGAALNEMPPATDRPPVRPVTFGELAGGEGIG
jgi:Fe-S-cluster-containing hydrogenase component 2/bacterioferritin-associated ferredoxin